MTERHDGRTDGSDRRIDVQADRWMDGQTNGWIYRRTDGWLDIQLYGH